MSHKWWKAPIAEVENEDGSTAIQVVSRGQVPFIPGSMAHVPKWMDVPFALVRTPENVSGIRDWVEVPDDQFAAEFFMIFGRTPFPAEGP